MKIILSLVVMTSFLFGCVSIPEINRANYAIEASWQKELDTLRRAYAARIYEVPQRVSFESMVRTMQNLGMVIDRRDRQKGLFIASAIAPRPLSDEEWKQVAKVEEPQMREIIGREIGPASATLFVLSPESYQIIFGAIVTEIKGGSLISFTARMKYIGGIRGVYTPKSPPPTAAKLGLIKIWRAFEKEMAERGYEFSGGRKTEPVEVPI